MNTGAEVLTEPEEESALSAVYRSERDDLVRFAAFVTGDVGAAVELVHDAFADLHEAWENIQSPAAWLRSAVGRRSVSWVRRRIVARRYLQTQTGGGSVAAVDVPQLVNVRQAVAKLSPQRRAVVFCRFYLDLSEAETARTLQVPLGTVKSRLSRAMRELEEALDD